MSALPFRLPFAHARPGVLRGDNSLTAARCHAGPPHSGAWHDACRSQEAPAPRRRKEGPSDVSSSDFASYPRRRARGVASHPRCRLRGACWRVQTRPQRGARHPHRHRRAFPAGSTDARRCSRGDRAGCAGHARGPCRFSAEGAELDVVDGVVTFYARFVPARVTAKAAAAIVARDDVYASRSVPVAGRFRLTTGRP